ncbi:spermine synthase, partial [Arenimonas sp. MALMAid1274]
SLSLGRASPESLASGVFRTGASELAQGSQVRFLRDGKTATVAFYQQESIGIISTNGKPDASLQLSAEQPAPEDEITMLMAAALPLALHPDARRVGIIGWGSGLTTHTVLGSPVPEVVDSVEIERAMYDGAMLYGDRVARAYRDPRSRLHIDDARTYFSAGKKKYDVIVSEPSNPWVSGVASLFTRQFYRFLAGHLDQDGLLVQWVQTYELNDRLLGTILSAIVSEFPHIDAYITNQGDVLLVASREPIPRLDKAWPEPSPLQDELSRVGLTHRGDYLLRRVGGRDLLDTLVRLNGATPHDDFHPTVSLQAPRSRFKGEASWQLLTLVSSGLPVLEMTDGRLPPPALPAITPVLTSDLVDLHRQALLVREVLRQGPDDELRRVNPEFSASIDRLAQLSAAPLEGEDLVAWLDIVSALAEASLAHLPAADHAGVWIDPAWIDTSIQPAAVAQVLEAYAESARRNPAGMRRAALAALEALGPDAPLGTREHMLVIAMLGAIGMNDASGALAIDRTQGRTVEVSAASSYGLQRAYLLAWIDRATAAPTSP